MCRQQFSFHMGVPLFEAVMGSNCISYFKVVGLEAPLDPGMDV
jgi:hypothetical protein